MMESNKSMTPDEMKEDYDWQQAFMASDEMLCEGATCAVSPVTVDNVSMILAYDEGVNDDQSWVAIVQLDDGRWAFVDAWCDYTGWDCQSGGQKWLSHSIENLWRFGISDEGRARLDAANPDAVTL